VKAARSEEHKGARSILWKKKTGRKSKLRLLRFLKQRPGTMRVRLNVEGLG